MEYLAGVFILPGKIREMYLGVNHQNVNSECIFKKKEQAERNAVTWGHLLGYSLNSGVGVVVNSPSPAFWSLW